MRKRKRSLADDPVTYRIDYSRVAQILHQATVREEGRSAVEQVELSERVKAAINAAGAAIPWERLDLELSPDAAVQRALDLIERARAELLRLGWRWVGRRPPWIVRKLRRRNSADDLRLAAFLDGVLEPATVVLYFSALIEAGAAGEALGSVETPVMPLDRKRGQRDEDWLPEYLFQLTEGASGRWPRLGRWLGITRWQNACEPSYRVRYNLACLYSRLAHQVSIREGESPVPLLEESAEQLRLCLGAVRSRQRAAILDWARRDPGLDGLREMGGDLFLGIVGPAGGAETEAGGPEARAQGEGEQPAGSS